MINLWGPYNHNGARAGSICLRVMDTTERACNEASTVAGAVDFQR